MFGFKMSKIDAALCIYFNMILGCNFYETHITLYRLKRATIDTKESPTLKQPNARVFTYRVLYVKMWPREAAYALSCLSACTFSVISI